MGSDYLLVLGIILLFAPDHAWIGLLCILAACLTKRLRPRKRRKLDQINL